MTQDSRSRILAPKGPISALVEPSAVWSSRKRRGPRRKARQRGRGSHREETCRRLLTNFWSIPKVLGKTKRQIRSMSSRTTCSDARIWSLMPPRNGRAPKRKKNLRRGAGARSFLVELLVPCRVDLRLAFLAKIRRALVDCNVFDN